MVLTKGTHITDCYPGGMAMPGRKTVGGELYRYGYQGEFAETDQETGKPMFQLRLYDPRINRWLSPDPYRQYFSPYLSMGNNPIRYVDPDGGCVGPDCIEGPAGTIGTDRNGLKWNWDGDAWNTDFSYLIGETIVIAKLTDHQRTMANPIVKAMHKTSRNFIKHPITLSFLFIFTAPTFIEAAPTLISTEFWIGKGVISATTQAVINDGNVDYADVGLDAVLTPGVSPIFRGFIDFTPKSNTNKVFGVFGDKSSNEFLIEVGSGYIGYGLGKRISPALSNLESNTSKGIAKTILDTNYSLTAKGINLKLQTDGDK